MKTSSDTGDTSHKLVEDVVRRCAYMKQEIHYMVEANPLATFVTDWLVKHAIIFWTAIGARSCRGQ